MSSGILFSGSLTATATVLYTPPVGKVSTFNARIFNPNTSDAIIRIGIALSATSSASSFLEFDFPIQAKGFIEETGIVMSNPQSFIVENSASGAVSITLWGFEEDSL